MDVPSLTFLGYAAIAAMLFNLSGNTLWRNLVLAAANIEFLSTFVTNFASVIPYACFVILGYVIIRLTRRGVEEEIYSAFIFIVILSFFILKKYTFIPNELILNYAYFIVGLSYVFFRVLHLVIDAGEPDEQGPIGLLDYINYVLFFPCLVSGPIQRYEDYRRMTSVAPAPLDMIAVGEAVERIVRGLFKVVVVSFILSTAHELVLDRLASDVTALDRVRDGALLISLFPIDLYFNFSGYTDFVIGIARFFRIELPENFNRPFSSLNFIDYWSRWHISLSNWLKTYVYTPLLKESMRRFPSPAVAPYLGVFALFVTFFLIGIWHGRTFSFFIFGCLNGFGVAANQFYQISLVRRFGRKWYAALAKNFYYRTICRGLTLSWVSLTLLWFRFDWPQLRQFGHILGPDAIVGALLLLFAGATLILAALEWAHGIMPRIRIGDMPAIHSRYVRTIWATMLAVVTAVTGIVMDSPAPDIIYKSF